MNRSFSLFALVFALFACGSSEPDGAGELTDRTVYPKGPYGLQEGDVIDGLGFLEADGKAFSLEDVFSDEKNRVLLITTTAGWCSACIDEQPKLIQLHKEMSGRGLEIVAAMFEDDTYAPATIAQVKAWKDHYQVPYRMVLDENFKLGAYYDRQSTPMTMVVDVDDMKIIKIMTGYNEQTIRAVIEANLPR